MRKVKRIALHTLVFAFIVIAIACASIPIYICPKKYNEYVEKYSKEYDLNENLVYAVIRAESNFDYEATSRKYAKGLMQITDATGLWAMQEMGLNDITPEKLYDPETNIMIGCWYLRKLTDQFNNTDTALAAYNAGSGNVSKWLNDENYSKDGVTLYKIPYGETDKYTKKIVIFKFLYDFFY